MAETTEITIHKRMVGNVIGVPPFCITKREVTRMKAAHPFMFIVVHIGRTKRAMFLRTPRRVSALSIVTGRVAALLFVKRAISTAGIILPNTWIGFMPLDKRNRGRTTKNWITFPPITTSTYFPSRQLHLQKSGQRAGLRMQ